MLKLENINDALRVARGTDANLHVIDVLFLAFSFDLDDPAKEELHRVMYKSELKGNDLRKFFDSPKMKALAEALKPFGIGVKDFEGISREENQAELVKTLKRIEQAMDSHELDVATGLKMQTDIRVKLQDKFDMDEESDEVRHIVMVPQKHDFICNVTNRECSKMPSVEGFLDYYGREQMIQYLKLND